MAQPTERGTSTASGAARGVPLYLRRDGDGYLVTDVVGIRYGWGVTPGEALKMWSDCVADILETESAGDPLLGEIQRYRQAFEVVSCG